MPFGVPAVSIDSSLYSKFHPDRTSGTDRIGQVLHHGAMFDPFSTPVKDTQMGVEAP